MLERNEELTVKPVHKNDGEVHGRLNVPRTSAMQRAGLLDIHQAAEYLGMSHRWLYRNYQAEQIPHVRIGSRILFRRTDLDQWIARRVEVGE
jgi:excisionase family DNA binding protein